MKRELVALSLLVLLCVGAGLNVRALDTLTGELLSALTLSETQACSGDYAAARETLDRALERWLSADGYTHIFLRHSEIDAVSDSFYDLRSELEAGEGEGLRSLYEKLQYHLDSIDRIEHLSLKSIL